MPEPMTAPIPRAVRLQGPSVLRRRWSGSSEAAISASMLRVRRSLSKPPPPTSALALALGHLFHFFLARTACDARGAFRSRGRLLSCGALQLLAFFGWEVLCVHRVKVRPS